MLILGDFNTTLEKALAEIDPKWKNYFAFVIAGTHAPKDIQEQLNIIKNCRQTKTPLLGVCFGYQLMAIEYARNILGIENATSEEFGEQGEFVVRKLTELNVGLKDGETYWNNYEVDPEFLKLWKIPDHFIGVQYHPEYQSSKDKPHPILLKFLKLCGSAVTPQA